MPSPISSVPWACSRHPPRHLLPCAAAAAFATNVQVQVAPCAAPGGRGGKPLADAQRQLFCGPAVAGCSTQEPPHYWVLAAGGASIEEVEPGLGFFFFLGWESATWSYCASPPPLRATRA